eukprot:3819015-Pyramimonas_sp.AAC.1
MGCALETRETIPTHLLGPEPRPGVHISCRYKRKPFSYCNSSLTDEVFLSTFWPGNRAYITFERTSVYKSSHLTPSARKRLSEHGATGLKGGSWVGGLEPP